MAGAAGIYPSANPSTKAPSTPTHDRYLPPRADDVMNAASILVGASTAIRLLRSTIEQIAPSSIPVLVEGPTGSGKELVAALLHGMSGRTGRLVAFNVCAITDSMFEDALFGHVRGAFTGAAADMPGYLREAHQGTLFLDEISGLSLTMQPKLLRSLETGAFRAVGSDRDAVSDFRLVAATNEALADLVASGRMRTDLAHRLSGIVLKVPPLDQRPDDIPMLVRHFAAGRPLDADAVRLLAERSWPGNVRELRQVVEAAFVFGRGTLDAHAVRAALAHRPGPSTSGDAERPSSLDDPLRVERRRLVSLLRRNVWDTVAAARELGVHRSTLYRRLKRLAIVLPPMRPRQRIARTLRDDIPFLLNSRMTAPLPPSAQVLSAFPPPAPQSGGGADGLRPN